jgi:fructokinase
MIAVTLGGDGAMAASAVGRTQLPADHVEVVDTVGSGDSFGAALVASLHEQDALALDSTRPLDDAVLEKAVYFAISVAALTSRRTGAAPPSRRGRRLRGRRLSLPAGPSLVRAVGASTR